MPKLGLGWVVAVGLVAFLLGFAVRGFVLPGAQPDLGIPSGPAFQSSPGGAGTAPPLSEEEMQKGMPEGHPPLEESPTVSESATPPASSP